jgi:hypothetical protein
MLKQNGIQLEGPGDITGQEFLEALDRAGGAQVDSSTGDGLYLYSAKERLGAGEYLYNQIVHKIEDMLDKEAGATGGLIDFFSDMSDDVANQMLNSFASDWSDTPSKDSEEWRNASPANAVSPDNMLFWDSPEKQSLYGFAAPLIYREPRREWITVHRWRKVRIKGSLTGIVRYQGQPKSGVMIQLYDGQTTFTEGNGRYRLDHIPFGSYVAKASADQGGIYLSASEPVTINSAEQNLDIALQDPPDLYRRLRIDGSLQIYDVHFFGDNPRRFERFYREIYVGPYGTHGEVSVSTDTDEGDNRVTLNVIADWQVDKSIRILVSLTESGENERSDSLAPFNLGAGSTDHKTIGLGAHGERQK